ncbi:GNAT family N-acetyltransferase [Microlunatus soli]|uniref:Ribosomal protein S18 acetylase RimI n=1 Tax=Microlunatus soli TaxID=630515 RepID=A0A1H1YKY7_9ACTN|nr:GNAT family N-acetyltransferase [Microlunatus soli]SDT21995.1 Ribosomal protein S18 acetylase RimI [Microlunatus soli]
MPAETGRKPSDPTVDEPTMQIEPTAPDASAVPASAANNSTPPAHPDDTRRSGLGRLLKRTKRRGQAPVDQPAAADETAATAGAPKPAEPASDGRADHDTSSDQATKDQATKDQATKDQPTTKSTTDAPFKAQPANEEPAPAAARDTAADPESADNRTDAAEESESEAGDDTAEIAKVAAGAGDRSSQTDAGESDDDTVVPSGADNPKPAEQAAPSVPVDPSATEPRRVWRCTRSTIVLVIVLMVVIGIAIPAAAALSLWLGVTGFGDQQVLVLSVIGGLALLTLFFGWRLGLHPRLIADGAELTIVNPFRTHRLDFADVTHFAPGGDGLMVGTAEQEIDAWCIQKPTGAIKAERHTRADKITEELWRIRDGYHRPVEPAVDEPHPAEIRFAHQDDAELLTQLERSASLARLGHIFPPDRYGFPEDDIRERWQAVLDDRTRQTMIAEVNGEPAGYVSIGIDTIHHMGVGEGYQRQGIGSELMAAAEDELFADVSTPEIELWVLEDNEVARGFYRAHGWTDTEDERDAEFPPYPNEIRMLRRNPHLARRGR